MISNTKSVDNLCTLISKTFDLTVFFITTSGEIAFELISNHTLNPLYDNNKKNLFNILEFDPKNKHDVPFIKKTAFHENYIIVSLLNDDSFTGSVIIGPFLTDHVSNRKVNEFINNLQAFPYRDEVLRYFKNIPIIDYDKSIEIALTIFYILNKEILSFETVVNYNQKLIHPIDINKKIDLNISGNLQNKVFHPNPLLEKKFLEIVKEGRVDELKTHTSGIANKDIVRLLNKSNYMRSVKNYSVILIALISRAAIEGGLHPEISFSLGDKFIQKLEDLHDHYSIESLMREVRYTFTLKVSQVKNENYSNTVLKCQDYIFTHIYENITLNDLAVEVNLDPSYLSVLFKKEVGMSISEYVQKSKINEAKTMIDYSGASFLEISSLLNFSDQSYFTKVFKKHVGVTPKQYRKGR